MASYKNYNESALISMLNNADNQIGEYTGVDGKEAALNRATVRYNAIAAELEARGKMNSNVAETSTKGTYNTADFKAMESWFRDSVIKFGPGGDVNIFLKQVDNGHRLCVTPENNLEAQFVKLAVNKLCAEYSSSFLDAHPDAATVSYEKFKKFMKDNYSTRETVFQVMQHMWEIERKPDEDIHSLGIRFQEKAAETATRITAMYEEKVNENKVAGNDDKKMTAADVFMLVGAMQLFSHIRIREPETYKLLVREIDGVYTPAELSKAAKLYTDRLDKTDPAAQSGVYVNSNRGGRPSSNSNGKTECFSFRDKGYCKYGNKCRFLHDPRHAKKASENKTPREDSQPHGNSNNSGRGYGNRGHGNRGYGNRGNGTSNNGGAHATQPTDTNATSNFNQVSREVFQLP